MRGSGCLRLRRPVTRAYARFLKEAAPVLRGIVRAKAGGLGEAACEDVLQEVLLAIHLKRHTWRVGSPVRPWLYAIARHKIIDAFRARGRRIQVPIDEFADLLPAADGPDPTEAADMARIIGLLEGRPAEILRRIAVDGLSVSETGKALAMSEGAVRVALHRALKALAVLRGRHET